MTRETVSEWRIVKDFFESLDRSDLSDEEKLEVWTLFVERDAKRQAAAPSRWLEDDLADISDPVVLGLVASVKQIVALQVEEERRGIPT